MGIVLAILASLTTGIGDILIKKGYKNFSPFASFVVISLMGLIIWPFSILFVKYDPSQLPAGLLYGALSGFLGQGYYIYVLSKGQLSITGTLLSTFPIFTVIFSVLINHEALSWLGMLAIALMIIGTIVVALPESKTKERIKPLLLILPITAAIGIGVSDSLSKFYINDAGAGTFLVATGIMQFVVSIFCFVLARGKLKEITTAFKNPKNYKFAFWGSFMLCLCILFVFLSFEFINASIAAPIIGTAPVFMLILARIFLKEKVSKKNLTGIIVVLIGILAASF